MEPVNTNGILQTVHTQEVIFFFFEILTCLKMFLFCSNVVKYKILAFFPLNVLEAFFLCLLAFRIAFLGTILF